MPKNPDQLRRWAAQQAANRLSGKKLTAIIPDPTRSGGKHVGTILRAIYDVRGPALENFIVLIALGTHAKVGQPQMAKYLGLTDDDFAAMPKLELVNHDWSDECMREIGRITADEWVELSGGVMDLRRLGCPEGVPVRLNRHVVEADETVIIGPVLPHEVVGCSGGYKYFSPGVGAPELTGFTHWLGAAVTIPNIIGKIETPVRRLVEHVGQMLKGPDKYCFALVVDGDDLKDYFFDEPIKAHRDAARETLKYNVEYTGRTYQRVVGILAPYYPEMWTGGKASYKLIQLVAPGGELIIYAPHLKEVSRTWGEQICKVGYHCFPYIDHHIERLLKEKIHPAVLAHVTHVFGPGEYKSGVETPSVVKLATGLDKDTTTKILNLGYIDPKSLDLDACRADPDTYVSENAGQRLVLPSSGPES